MELDPLAHADGMHRILTSIVTPRPIGWISTRTADRDNLAPYSYFNAVSTYPPVVMFSGSFRDGEPKDAGRMAVESGEFVANLVTEDLAEVMDATSTPIGDESEFDYVGIERAPAETVDAPRVAGAAACLECTVYDTLQVHQNLVVFGAVQHIYIHDQLLTDGVIDMRKVDSVGRLGGPFYTGLRFLELERGNFGVWTGPVPAGFERDPDSRQLRVKPEVFEEIRRLLVQVEDGADPNQITSESAISTEDLKACFARRDLYLGGETEDERIEAALAAAGYDTAYVL